MLTVPSAVLEGLRVLVVEDEWLLADDVAQALSRLGARVVGPASSPAAGLAALDAEPSIDFAVLDINLNSEMIFPLADELQRRGIPFVFATGYDQTAVPERFSGVPRWQKPFSAEALAGSLGSRAEDRTAT